MSRTEDERPLLPKRKRPAPTGQHGRGWPPCSCGQAVCPEVKARQGAKVKPSELFRADLNPHLD